MNVLLDTNVVLDLLLAREPFVHEATSIFALGEDGRFKLLLSTDAISTIAYVIERNCDAATARTAIQNLVGRVHLASLDEATVLRALALGFDDTEDALVAAVAERERADVIVTRNRKDFDKSPVVTMTPREFLSFWCSLNGDAVQENDASAELGGGLAGEDENETLAEG